MPLYRFPPQLYAFILVSLLCHVTMSGGRMAAGLFVLHEGYSAGVAGAVYSLYSLLPVFFAIHVGRLIDRIGMARVIRGAQLAMLAALLVPALWPHPWTMFFTALASGLGFNSFMLAALVYVGHAADGDSKLRTSMFGWVMLGNSVSAVLGPALTGMVIDDAGFRAAFTMLAAIVGLSLLAGLWVRLGEAGVERAQQPARTEARSIWRLLAEERGMQRVFVVSAVLALAWDSFVFLAPVVGHLRGYSATQIGLVMSAFAIGTFSVRLFMPWITERIGEWRLLCAALVANAVTFALLPVSALHGAMVALAFAFGFSTGGAQPNALSLLHKAAPHGREGESMGLRATVNHLVGAVNPSVLGALLAVAGATPVFGVVAVMMLGGAAMARRAEKAEARV